MAASPLGVPVDSPTALNRTGTKQSALLADPLILASNLLPAGSFGAVYFDIYRFLYAFGVARRRIL